jgi:protease-4
MLNNQPNLPNDLIRELINERRSEKRWKNVRFFIVFLFIALIVFALFSANRTIIPEEGGYVSLVKLDGMIEAGQSFSADEVLPILKDAFSDSHAKGVILEINSGGGTPVQASIIHDAVVEMKNKYHKRVIVVGEDLLASGAYFVAVAADEIYVNPNTITGSIGVIMKGFGFPDLIKKIGVDRRVYTAGVNKDRLDPFMPQNQEDVQKIQTVISEVHHNFINVVKEGRKGKLNADESVLFSGDFWSGESALKLGLVDGLGNMSSVMQKEFQVSRFKDYSSSQGVIKTLMGQLGMSFNAAMNSSTQVGLQEKI